MSAGSSAPSVTLGWDANEAQPDVLSGYRLYYGTLPGRQYSASNWVDVPQTTCRVSNLVEGVTYYFAVTAVTVGGLESDYSTEISYRVPISQPPALDYTYVDYSPAAPITSPGLIQTEEVVEPGFNLVTTNPGPKTGGPRLDIFPYGQPILAYSVGFEAPAGKACELQVSTDLQVWRKVFYRGSQPLSERLEFFDFPGESKSRRYYRVAVW